MGIAALAVVLAVRKRTEAVSARDPVHPGELRVHVRESDTELPLIARVVVRALSADAASNERARTVDLRQGEASLTIGPGRYRVSAGRGVEWTRDAAIVDIASGGSHDVALYLRHVVPSLTLVACDVHVDTTMRDDERVLAAAAAGLQLAVTMGHGGVVDDRAALSRTDLVGRLAVVGGIELVTTEPAFGRFGVFPYPLFAPPPNAAHATAPALFETARRSDTPRLILADRLAEPSAVLAGADLFEVYRGADLGETAKSDEGLRDWFALLETGTRVLACGASGDQATALGSPRTYVDIGTWKQGYSGAPLDIGATLDALRNGRGFVTSGPTLAFSMYGDAVVDPGVNAGADTNLSAEDAHEARPGATLRWAPHLRAHLTIRAPAWLDVSSFEVIASSERILLTPLPQRPLFTGREAGPATEAVARAVRFDGDIELALPPSARWVVVVARGESADEDAIPGVHLRPLAFTHPIWLNR